MRMIGHKQPLDMASQLLKRPMLVAAMISIVAILLYGAFPSLALSLSFLVVALSLGLLYRLRVYLGLTMHAHSVLLYGIALSSFAALSAFLPYAFDHALGIHESAYPRYTEARLVILSPSVIKNDRVRYDAQILSEIGALSSRKVMLFLAEGDSAACGLNPGTRVRAHINIRSTGSIVRSVSSQSFGRYLLSRRISATCYARGNIEIEGQFVYNPVIIYAQRLKKRLINQLQTLPLSPSDRSALATLCLGRSDVGDVERDLQQRYASVGASHLLAVSGFHLGVVVSLVMFLCYPFRRFAWGGHFIHIIAVLSAWIFTFITGLAEPTIRASLMVSFLLLGRLVGRRVDRANLLAASALCILIFNPYAVYSIGFALSYIAVLSIILFYPLLYHLVRNFSNPLFRGLWSIFCIGLSVQFLSIPLSLYFFGTNALLGVFVNVPLSLLASVLIPVGLIWMVASMLFNAPLWIAKGIASFVQFNGRLVDTLSDIQLPTLDYQPSFLFVLIVWIGLIYLSVCWYNLEVRRRSLGR